MRTGEQKKTYTGDSELVAMALAGDKGAFVEIIQQYKDAVFGVALSITGSFHEAEDVAQETFTDAYFNLSKLNHHDKLGAWLCGISRIKAHSRMRRKYSKPAQQPIESLKDIIPDGSKDPVDIAVDNEVKSMVISAINSLSPVQRDAVVLYYIDGYSQLEVAGFLNVPLGTVKRRLHDARKRIKKELVPMVREGLVGNKPSEDFIAKVEEALEKAQNAYDHRDYKEASAQCDLALDMLAKLPEGGGVGDLKLKALSLKGGSIYYPLGVKEALKYFEQVLALYEKADDKKKYADYLINIGTMYSSAKDSQSALDAYTKAYKVSSEIDDKQVMAKSLLWLGNYYFTSDPRRALSYFEEALPLLKQTQTRDWEAVCTAGISALNKTSCLPPVKSLKFFRFTAICEMLKVESDAIIFVHQPGFVTFIKNRKEENALTIDVFHSIGQMKKIIDLTKIVGDTWSENVFSYTFNPMTATAAVESDKERVSVAAGEFENCLKIKFTITPSDQDDKSERNAKFNLLNSGIKEMWYAPGVGLVRLKIQRGDGLMADIQLDDYTIAEPSKDYLPLSVGNRWSYKAVGISEGYVQDDIYEVLSKDGDMYYIAQHEIAYYSGSNEEYDKLPR